MPGPVIHGMEARFWRSINPGKADTQGVRESMLSKRARDLNTAGAGALKVLLANKGGQGWPLICVVAFAGTGRPVLCRLCSGQLDHAQGIQGILSRAPRHLVKGLRTCVLLCLLMSAVAWIGWVQDVRDIPI